MTDSTTPHRPGRVPRRRIDHLEPRPEPPLSWARVPPPLRDRAIPLGASLLAFALALVQRPGLASADTKIDLLTDPSGFLVDVASVWSPTGDLGHVQGGQYAGY